MTPWILTLAGLALTIALVLVNTGTAWGRNTSSVDNARDSAAAANSTSTQHGKKLAEHSSKLAVHNIQIQSLKESDADIKAQLTRFEGDTKESLKELHRKLDDVVTAVIAGGRNNSRTGRNVLTTAEQDPEA